MLTIWLARNMPLLLTLGGVIFVASLANWIISVEKAAWISVRRVGVNFVITLYRQSCAIISGVLAALPCRAR